MIDNRLVEKKLRRILKKMVDLCKQASKAMRKYRLSIILGLLIIIIFFILPTTISSSSKQTVKDNLPTIFAIGGFLFSIPIKIFWDDYKKPYLKITRVDPVRSSVPEYDSDIIIFRVIVENKGRSAAINCKGYFVTKTGRERVCWKIPSNRGTITINANDEEALDFCGFGKSKFFVPTENGWDSVRAYRIYHGSVGTEGETVTLVRDRVESYHELELPDEVLISAENADPVYRKVILNVTDKKLELQS